MNDYLVWKNALTRHVLPAILVASTEVAPRQQQRIHTTGNKHRNRMKRIAKASRRRNRK
jgi:hypothetical protein